MEFKVTFRSSTGELIRHTVGEVGIDILDRALKTYPELTQISTSNISIDNQKSLCGRSTTTTIPEKLARISGLFSIKTNIIVVVSGGMFTKYQHLEVYRKLQNIVKKPAMYFGHIELRGAKYEEEMISARVYNVFNKADMLSDWRDCGFPELWLNAKDQREHDAEEERLSRSDDQEPYGTEDVRHLVEGMLT